MAYQGGLRKWFRRLERYWSKKKSGKYQKCGRKSAKGSKRKYPKCVPAAKARTMSASQKEVR